MKRILLLIWAILTMYSLFFTNHLSSDLSILFDMTSLQGITSNLFLFAIFNLMGLWPFLFAREIFAKGTTKVITIILWFMSFAIGAFAMLPLLVTMSRNGSINVEGIKKIVTSKIYLWIIVIPTITLMVIGAVFGDVRTYLVLFINNRFIHIMTLDFLVLCLGFLSIKINQKLSHNV